jgi:hypothetical protein
MRSILDYIDEEEHTKHEGERRGNRILHQIVAIIFLPAFGVDRVGTVAAILACKWTPTSVVFNFG